MSQKLSHNNYCLIITIFMCMQSFKIIDTNTANELIRDLPNLGDSCHYNKNTTTRIRKCGSNLICDQNRCKCPIGYGFATTECIPFTQFDCQEDSQCNALDTNRVCNSMNHKCKCNSDNGYQEDSITKVCTNGHSLLNNICLTDMDCNVKYSSCKDSVCKCWPEFEEKLKNGKLFCSRRLCTNNSECIVEDNPNLVCNNTICECEYGYSLDNQRICLKISKRQNCNITCQIIGGLFASIFMLSLIYWCFYCCYSIVKNYKLHNRNRSHPMAAESERFTATTMSSNDNHLVRNITYSVNHTTDPTYYCFDAESPPTYSQLSDDPPDYDTVVHLKPND